jgi:hypothetical protein
MPVTNVCSLNWPGVLHTPHEGDYVDAQLDIDDLGDGTLEVDLVQPDGSGSPLAYLNVETHRVFLLNPGLRTALLDRVKAYTLVRG